MNNFRNYAVEDEFEVTIRTSEADCFLVSDTQPSPMDSIELMPQEGAFRWVQGDGRGSGGSGWMKVEPNTPSTTRLIVNDLYRFDQQGSYTVRVRTRHLHCGGFSVAKADELTTNAVSFEVELFAKTDEKELAESLERRIRASTCKGDAEKLAEQLKYLPGDDAARVKLSLYLHEKTFYLFGIDVSEGLWIARNRPMVVSALEQAVADPTTELGASSGLLSILVELKRDSVKPQQSEFPRGQPPPDNLMAQYIHEIAISLPQRTGDSRIEAALTVFAADASNSDHEPVVKADFELAREVVISHFREINEYNVGSILQRYGAYLEDRRIIPALQNLVDHSVGVFSGNRTDAMKQMQRIAPEGLDTYLAQEACSDHPAMIKQIRDLSKVETLPSVDTCLGDRLRMILAQPPGTHSDLRLDRTLEYIARFADGALVPAVWKAYTTHQSDDRRWDQDARGAALCYLVRWNPSQAGPLLIEVMPGHAYADHFVLFDVVGPAMPSASGLRSLFRQQIEAGSADTGATVYALTQIGMAEDRQYLHTRLDALHRKDTSAYSQEDAGLEVELVSAQISGRTWDYSGDEAKQIAETECVSAECRQHFNVH